MPSFNTLLHNSHVIFSRCWNTCSLDNKIVGHLAVLNCIWCLQLLVVLFCTCEFYLLFVCFMCFMCVWCVYYVFYVYMGQVPEIKLMMMMTFRWSLSSRSVISQSDPPHADAAIETDLPAVRPATTPDRNLSRAPYCMCVQQLQCDISVTGRSHYGRMRSAFILSSITACLHTHGSSSLNHKQHLDRFIRFGRAHKVMIVSSWPIDRQ